MTITELAPQEFQTWDQYVRDHSFPESLAQTALWPGDFFIVAQRDEGGKILSGVRIDVRTLWLGKRMWWIRGQLKTQSSNLKTDDRNEMLLYLIEKARRENIVFIRFQSQPWDNLTMKQCIPPRFLFHVVDPEQTLMADLRFSEKELLAAMHPKTRYNIRLAEKRGITVGNGTLDEFYALYQATNRHKHLRGYSRDYFEKLLNVTAPLSTHILIARKKELPLASSFLVGFGTTCTYLFGGSSDRHRELMAPHLLHWESMRLAKRQGWEWYDFGGISDTNPLWHGITRFKRSFISSQTGREIDHGKTYDLVIQPRWYSLFSFVKRVMW